jgi:hypothetical protein
MKKNNPNLGACSDCGKPVYDLYSSTKYHGQKGRVFKNPKNGERKLIHVRCQVKIWGEDTN